MKNKLFYISTLFFVIALLVTLNWGMGPAKPKKIKTLLDTVLEANDGQEVFCAEFKKLTGIILEINKPPHNVYNEKFRAQFASGDLPDIAEIPTGAYVSTAASGNLLALDDLIANSKNCKLINKKYYEHYRLKDGKIHAFPINSGGGCLTYIRKDWLDKLKLKIPTTYAELYEVMKAFTFKDPDGNGKADTIGYTLSMKVPTDEIDYYNRLIMQNANFYFIKKGSKWVDGFSEPEFKGALERFKKLYQEKIIDQEIFTNTTSAARTKVYDGQCGLMEYWAGNWAKTMSQNTKAKYPNAEIIPIPPIKETVYYNRVAPCFGITKAVKNPKAVFDNFIDLMWDKGPGQLLFVHGVEGFHFKKVGDKIEKQPSKSNPKNVYSKSYIEEWLILNDFRPETTDIYYLLMAKSMEIFKKYSIQLALPEGKEFFLKNVGDLNSLKLELFSKILTGKISTDEGLTLYKEKARRLKLNEMLAELNS